MTIKRHIGIDLGTDNTRIYLRGGGIVINEPSIVAFNNRTNKVVAVGKRAKEMLSRTPSHITAIRPIGHGVIADFDMAKEMVQAFLKKNKFSWAWLTDVVGTVPTNLTEVERKSVVDLMKETGVNKVYLLEQPLAAAFSSRLSVGEPTAYLMVDMGAGTTDMAIISMNGIVVSRRLKIAGDYFNDCIIKGVEKDLKLDIGQPTAEDIKLAVGSAVPQEEVMEVTVRGRDLSSGLPREISVRDNHVRSWLSASLEDITDSLKDLIDVTPPELVGDIYKNGIYVTGGGALLRGVNELFAEAIGVEVNIVDDPKTSVARGAGMVTEDVSGFMHLLNNFNPSPLEDKSS